MDFLEFLLYVLCFWTLVSFVSECQISYRGQSWGEGGYLGLFLRLICFCEVFLFVCFVCPPGRKILKTFDKVLLLSFIMELQ